MTRLGFPAVPRRRTRERRGRLARLVSAATIAVAVALAPSTAVALWSATATPPAATLQMGTVAPPTITCEQGWNLLDNYWARVSWPAAANGATVAAMGTNGTTTVELRAPATGAGQVMFSSGLLGSILGLVNSLLFGANDGTFRVYLLAANQAWTAESPSVGITKTGSVWTCSP